MGNQRVHLDFAPMEGITGAAFRRLYNAYFGNVDRYYAPFLSPTSDHLLTKREQRELLPENNRGICLIPQILTKVPEDFLWAAEELCGMGYRQVNLNLGCPSGTVTAKGKGAGMLADPAGLDRFLEKIFVDAPCPISVKTRLGMEREEEFPTLLEIFNRYPIAELIVHPRVRKDFYKHPVRTDAFAWVASDCKCPLTYNGAITSAKDYESCTERFPNLYAVMIGQGIIADPFLPGKIRHNTMGNVPTLQRFHDELLDAYTEQFGNVWNAVQRMKELWAYLNCSFTDNTDWIKKIRKSTNAAQYQQLAADAFSFMELL